jgi:hypothetical protein
MPLSVQVPAQMHITESSPIPVETGLSAQLAEIGQGLLKIASKWEETRLIGTQKSKSANKPVSEQKQLQIERQGRGGGI